METGSPAAVVYTAQQAADATVESMLGANPRAALAGTMREKLIRAAEASPGVGPTERDLIMAKTRLTRLGGGDEVQAMLGGFRSLEEKFRPDAELLRVARRPQPERDRQPDAGQGPAWRAHLRPAEP